MRGSKLIHMFAVHLWAQTILPMKLLAPLLLLSLPCLAQNVDMPLNLPRDNGKTVSWCLDSKIGRNAKEYYDSVCANIPGLRGVRTIRCGETETFAQFVENQMGHGLYCELHVKLCGKYVNYCIDHFTVDRIPLDEWLASGMAPAIVMDQIKSYVFTSTVFRQNQMRDVDASFSRR